MGGLDWLIGGCSACSVKYRETVASDATIASIVHRKHISVLLQSGRRRAVHLCNEPFSCVVIDFAGAASPALIALDLVHSVDIAIFNVIVDEALARLFRDQETCRE